VRATDLDGSDWPDSHLLVGAVVAPEPQLIGLVSEPGVAFVDGGASSKLFFSRGLDADGLSWSSPLELALCGSTAIAMQRIGGSPALCFLRDSDAHACYLQADDGAGGLWSGGEVEISDDPDIQFMSSTPVLIETVNNRPAVAAEMVDGTTLLSAGALYLLGNAAGTNWSQKANPAPGSGGIPGLTIYDGTPIMVYVRDSDGDGNDNVVMVRALDGDGTSWGAEEDTGIELPLVLRLQALQVNYRLGLLISSLENGSDHEYWTYLLE
jgi:hypothetical protein